MIKPPIRTASGTLAGVLLGTTALATPALGQVAGHLERPALDANGVDVITGKLTTAPVSITAGPAGEGLTFVSGYANGSLYDSFDVELETFVGGKKCVKLVGVRRCFGLEEDGSYSSREGDGATLVADVANGRYTYTTRDGTEYLFLTGYGDSDAAPLARLRTVTSPAGEIATYTYRTDNDSARVQSVVNNRGYQLKPTYASNDPVNPGFKRLVKVTAINRGVEFCSPAADSCTLTGDWPELQLASTSRTLDITNKTGEKVVYTLASGELASETRPGDVITFAAEYNSDGKVKKLSRGEGSWTYYYGETLDGRHRTVVAQPLGGERVYIAEPATKRVEVIVDELDQITRFAYDGLGRLTETTYPETNKVALTYDARGNVTETRAKAKANSGLADIVTSATFPASCASPKTCNRPVSATDANGNVTDFAYDTAHGGLVSVTRPAPTMGSVRPQVRYTYAARSARFKDSTGAFVDGTPIHRLTSVSTCQTQASCNGTADEVVTALGYNSGTSANNLIPTSVTTAAGDASLSAATAYAYDVFGRIVSVDGPLAGTNDTVYYRYDVAGRRSGTILPDPDASGPMKRRAERVTYDFGGLWARTEIGTVEGLSDTQWAAFAPLTASRTEYDRFGRIRQVALLEGQSRRALTQMSYDERGRLQCTAIRMNPDQLNTPPTDACERGTEGSFGPDRITRHQYNSGNQLLWIATGYGDLRGEGEDVEAPRREASYAYTANGRLRSIADAENNLTGFGYDGHDRLFRTRFPKRDAKGQDATSSTDFEQFGYDAAGNLTGRRLRDGQVIGLAYDKLNRMSAKDLPGSELDVTYGYDNLGRMISASRTSHALSFTYDSLGRNRTQSGPQGTVRFSYDSAGRRTRTAWADGFAVSYERLRTGELSSITEFEDAADTTPFTLATFAYDNLGRRTSLTRGNGTVTSYSYDPLSRLQTLSHDLNGTSHDLNLGFGYDPASAIVSHTRSNDVYALNPQPAGSTSYATGGLNQLLTVNAAAVTHDARGNLTSDGARTFGYSSENLLTSGPNNAALIYDPLMRLYETSANGVALRRFVYDGLDMIAEYDANGQLTDRYVHGPGMDEPLVHYSGSAGDTRRWLHADERRSVVAESNSNGVVTSTKRYDEYGTPASGNGGRFQYTGQVWLPELGLYYYKARMYDPQLRFLQPDPIGYGDGMNLYAYVSADPVNSTDPSGTTEEIVITATWRPEVNPMDVQFYMGMQEMMRELARQLEQMREPPIIVCAGVWDPETSACLPKKKGLTSCQRTFAQNQLNMRGFATSHLGSVQFIGTMRGAGAVVSAARRNGNPAITRGNTVHVNTADWGWITNPHHPSGTFWAEIAHTAQYKVGGSFDTQYIASVIGSGLTGGDGHRGNLIEEIGHRIGAELASAWNQGGSSRCR